MDFSAAIIMAAIMGFVSGFSLGAVVIALAARWAQREGGKMS